MRRTSAGFAVLALASTALLQVQSAAAAEACSDSYLTPLASWERSPITAADPSGRYQVAQLGDRTGRLGVGIWRNGVAETMIPLLDGYIEPLDVNVRAEVVGFGYASGESVGAWRARGTQRTTLPLPAGADSAKAVAINAAGEVAGVITTASGSQGVVWSPSNEPRALPVPDGLTSAEAKDIDDDGTVVGFAGKQDQFGMLTRQPVVWPADGGYRLLPATDQAYTWPSAVRNGIAIGEDGQSVASWNLATDTETLIAATEARAGDVNAGGDFTITRTPSAAPAVTDFIRRGQPVRAAGPGYAIGLSDSGRVYYEDHHVFDCGS
ncbi:hypothetical protein [Kribbella ginsengisoli]|uniref:HAF family extracellular repeat protein n=1 Tax=Kribbella ginsengisoli TaxID=363865 RepID=A0ABP6XDV6_9ACTN